MSYSREDEDLHECCAVDCAQAGTEFLIIKSWLSTDMEEKMRKQTLPPPISLLLVDIIAKTTWLRN
jgi:hypothetical protein